jgi:hypothetical protein
MSPGYELVPDPATGTSRLQRRGPSIDQFGGLHTQGTTKKCADYPAEVVTTGVTAFSAPVITEHKVTVSIQGSGRAASRMRASSLIPE